jgi:HAD superfamily hydrolase (TIGR01544 family)
MENVIISNKEYFEKLKQKIISGGADKFHVVADFDRTLTKASVKGKSIPSIISVLRNENYLSEEYSKKANALASKYHPIEIDPKIPLSEKKKYMEEWWKNHFELLIESELNKRNLGRIINEGNVEFREGAEDFLDLLHEKKIPLVILSSSGVGDLIPMYLEKHGKLYNNIHIISNLYKWDKQGNAIDIKKPIIHVFNKDETSVKNHPRIYKEVKERKNVLLLGDSLGDLGMICGFDYKNLLKIGFLNEEIERDLEEYKKNFDVVITNDSDMGYVNELIRKIN